MTAAELSTRGPVALGLPSAAAALREAGVIQAEIAVIDPKAVGRRITMIVTVTLEREHSDVITEFKRACRETVEVMQCYYVTGRRIS
jgi:DNA-binding Lrp family transcriptional regulator